VDYKRARDEVKQAFTDAPPDDPIVQRKQMFGYPCAYVNGNMVGGVHEDNIVVRLLRQGASRRWRCRALRRLRRWARQ
jgi:hypothetical protein